VAADDPDEIDDVLGDHPGRCDELVPGGVERDADTELFPTWLRRVAISGAGDHRDE